MRVVAAVTDAHDTSAATERIADLMARAQAVCPIDSPRFGPRCREIGEWNPSRECRG